MVESCQGKKTGLTAENVAIKIYGSVSRKKEQVKAAVFIIGAVFCLFF